MGTLVSRETYSINEKDNESYQKLQEGLAPYYVAFYAYFFDLTGSLLVPSLCPHREAASCL